MVSKHLRSQVHLRSAFYSLLTKQPCLPQSHPLTATYVKGSFHVFPDNLGDGIDYGQQRRQNLGELIMETLEAFEVNGGEDAFINIKYLVPVYQSVVIS